MSAIDVQCDSEGCNFNNVPVAKEPVLIAASGVVFVTSTSAFVRCLEIKSGWGAAFCGFLMLGSLYVGYNQINHLPALNPPAAMVS